MTSSPAYFNYARFNDAQVSRATLMQGFHITDQQWSNIALMVTTELHKRGLTSNHSLRTKFAKRTVETVRLKIIRAFPELSFYVPQQYLVKGTYQIIRAIQASRKRGSSRADRTFRRAAVPPIPTPSSISAPNPGVSSSDIKIDFGSPPASSEPVAQTDPASSPPAAVPAHAATTSDTSNDIHIDPLPFTTTVTQDEISGANSALNATVWQSNVKDSQNLREDPSQSSLAPTFPQIQIHEDLKKIQLHAARLNDQRDSSFINLGELLAYNTNRQGLGAISYSSLEDLTDQDWQYWHGTILRNDLDTGFDWGIDKIYYDNGGGEMIRVKNAHNWRAAMVAMRTAGLTHFKFYVEQPQVQRESTLNRLLMPVSSALANRGSWSLETEKN